MTDSYTQGQNLGVAFGRGMYNARQIGRGINIARRIVRDRGSLLEFRLCI